MIYIEQKENKRKPALIQTKKLNIFFFLADVNGYTKMNHRNVLENNTE